MANVLIIGFWLGMKWGESEANEKNRERNEYRPAEPLWDDTDCWRCPECGQEIRIWMEKK